MTVLQQFLTRNRARRVTVHVVGDSMLDEYQDVRVTRLSPESPNVKVMRGLTVVPRASLPGGAANVCYQLSNLNVHSVLFSFLDEPAAQAFGAAGIKMCGEFLGPDHLIPRKRRFFDGEIQVGDRWDIEADGYGLGDALAARQISLFDKMSYFHPPDVVILSDYNKGVFHGRGPCNFSHTAPVVVDPKTHPLDRWKGCTVFKPNATEAAALSGKATWQEQADFFMSALGCQGVVITGGGRGVRGRNGDGHFEYDCAVVVPPVKLSGAGDCFVGFLAVALAQQFSIPEAAQIAFEAGRSFVQQPGTAPVTPWQLDHQSKFVKPEDLRDGRKGKLVLTNGCHDVLHSGHLGTLRFAKGKGDKLVVAVNSDESVRRLKGPGRPVVPLAERMEMLAALECVDYVVSFDEDDPLAVIKTVRPDVLIKGADWAERGAVGRDLVAEVYYAPLVEDRSTTSIIDKIRRLA